DDRATHRRRARGGVGTDHAGRGQRQARRGGQRPGERAGRARAARAAHAQDGAQPRGRRAAGDGAGARAQGLRVATEHPRLRGRCQILRRETTTAVPGAIAMAQTLGLILANRAVVLGAIKARDLLEQTEAAEASGVFDAVWVGDSLLAKPRLESVALLSALAAVTRRVRLGVGCLATFVHRHPVLFAQQWASLDVLSEGRAWLAVFLGRPDNANAAPAA